MPLYVFQHRISWDFQKCPPFISWTIRTCDENGEKWQVYPGKPSKRCPFYPGKPSQKCPSYPRGQTKQKLAILPAWANQEKTVHLTRVGKHSQKCPFCPRTSIHSTKLVIPHGTILKKHEIILARAKALQ